mmetsp:Transcript_12012/g.25381  ORF Transcript_12012/g.25381 Transcript_12012/m.25381 type:complete len:149 (+) Transcript_12012:1422-1868(+)
MQSQDNATTMSGFANEPMAHGVSRNLPGEEEDAVPKGDHPDTDPSEANGRVSFELERPRYACRNAMQPKRHRPVQRTKQWCTVCRANAQRCGRFAFLRTAQRRLSDVWCAANKYGVHGTTWRWIGLGLCHAPNDCSRNVVGKRSPPSL